MWIELRYNIAPFDNISLYKIPQRPMDTRIMQACLLASTAAFPAHAHGIRGGWRW
ncbi:hypothetical protein BEI_0877 [Halomonas beimenensis]|uniref:Uncharacterized protein n=1 Tax=Halomonas beimenensis TaxID=475662 RepID=A0A291P4L7_9GAMM|nr:hypothetical protein BEI_0877 [Halomonas beimenensis]